MNSQSEAQISNSTAATDNEEIDEEAPSVQALAGEVQTLRAEVAELRADKEQLEQTVETQAERLDRQATTIEEMEEQLAEIEIEQDQSSEHRKHLQGRLHTLEAESEETDTSSASADDEEPSTPLGRILQLPKEVVQKKLSANQQRALLIAKDIREYAKQVPAGFAVNSRTIRTVLQAKEEQALHTQTITRVMEFLDRLGKEHVRVVKRRGTKRVIFTETTVDRLSEVARKSSRGSEGSAGGIIDVVIGGR